MAGSGARSFFTACDRRQRQLTLFFWTARERGLATLAEINLDAKKWKQLRALVMSYAGIAASAAAAKRLRQRADKFFCRVKKQNGEQGILINGSYDSEFFSFLKRSTRAVLGFETSSGNVLVGPQHRGLGRTRGNSVGQRISAV